jgi:two-component system, OmpR family, phosphate regulon sensor histidine kinase PhoR
MTKRLLWQIYPSFLLIIMISVVGVAWYGSQSLYKFHIEQTTQDLRSRALLIEQQITSYLQNGSFKEIDSFCKRAAAAGPTRVTVILPDGQVIADSDEIPAQMKNHADRPEFTEAVQTGSGNAVRFSETLGKRMMYQAVPVTREDQLLAVIRTSVVITAIDEALGSFYQRLFWAVLLISLVAAIISLAISKKITRPIEQMTSVATRFAAGELDLRVAIPKATELAELAVALNQMAQQLNARIETIQKERGRMETILSSMAEGVLAIDSTGHIVSINQAAANLLNVDTDVIGSSIEEAARNPQLLQSVADILRHEHPGTSEACIVKENGRCLQLYSSILTDPQGVRSGAVLVLQDITRTRQLEEVRRDFVANVSHELKTPVTSIKGFVETLLDGALYEPHQVQRFLTIISRHSDRLNAIIDDLLSLSRLEEETEKRRLSFEEAPIKPALNSAIELAKLKADDKHIELKLRCDSKITAKINAPLIEQAVLNLIDNAIKYSQENSLIEVQAERTASQTVIRVADHGSGIPQEHLDRIFERFYVVDKGRSRKLGGTGLGLSIVKHIAQVHGGRVDVKSTLGEGTTFEIRLPVQSAE